MKGEKSMRNGIKGSIKKFKAELKKKELEFLDQGRQLVDKINEIKRKIVAADLIIEPMAEIGKETNGRRHLKKIRKQNSTKFVVLELIRQYLTKFYRSKFTPSELATILSNKFKINIDTPLVAKSFYCLFQEGHLSKDKNNEGRLRYFTTINSRILITKRFDQNGKRRSHRKILCNCKQNFIVRNNTCMDCLLEKQKSFQL